MLRTARATCLVLAMSSVAGAAVAQGPGPTPAASSSAGPARAAGHGVAVVAIGSAREEAFQLARALYAGRLRPTALDEIRARVLAGGPAPANASRELRELAEIREGLSGEDAASRQLLAGIARQVGAEALLLVKVERPLPSVSSPAPESPKAESPRATETDAATDAEPPAAGNAGNAAHPSTVVARLFLASSEELDAARYSPDPGATGSAAWKSTILSLEGRFPQGSQVVAANARPAPQMSPRPENEKSQPFYASGWFWGALGAAALVGAAFYFASRDTGSDPIHLQMQVPK